SLHQNPKKPITRIQAYRIMNAAAEKVGLDEIGTHTLRKTFGYHYYQKTKDVVMLQTIFNHSAPSITLRYIGIQQDEIDKSLEDFSL
ncbi:site-specific integrase, partial [Bacillus thuringiensis]|uniref:tyrosine-type recombinase/integrase n=1 Tax=Bacillus thuringiensis TaxID=1428 RepID=UPI000C004527